MKFIAIIAISLFSFRAVGQRLDSCGVDQNPHLNSSETHYFDGLFAEKREAFTFSNKKILFVTGSGGSLVGTKGDYFDNVRRWRLMNRTIHSYFIPLSEKQKADSGGYDVIITYWAKTVLSVRGILKKARNKKS